MDCTKNFEDQTLVPTLRGEKLKQVVGHLLAAGLVLSGFHFLEYRSTARIAGEFIGLLFGIFVILRQRFGTSILTVQRMRYLSTDILSGLGGQGPSRAPMLSAQVTSPKQIKTMLLLL